jgi:hypothetical protein
MMSIISDAIIGGIAWEAFSKTVGFYAQEVNDFALSVYIKQQLKAIGEIEDVSDKEIEEIADIIETTVAETPEEIRQIDNSTKQKEAFEEYIKRSLKNKNIYAKNYFEKIVAKDKATINFNFGDTLPK